MKVRYEIVFGGLCECANENSMFDKYWKVQTIFHMNVPLIIYGIDLLSNKPYFQDLKALKHEMSINTSKPILD